MKCLTWNCQRLRPVFVRRRWLLPFDRRVAGPASSAITAIPQDPRRWRGCGAAAAEQLEGALASAEAISNTAAATALIAAAAAAAAKGAGGRVLAAAAAAAESHAGETAPANVELAVLVYV